MTSNSEAPPPKWPRLSDIEAKPVPVLLASPTTGAGLLVQGEFNLWWGKPGCGKSWVSLWCAASLGVPVLWASFEQSLALIAHRRNVLGIGGETVWVAHHPLHEDVAKWCKANPSGLLVIDSLESSGCPSDTGNISDWLNRWVNPATKAGCTVLGIDHLAKHTDGDDWPKGSTAKKQHIQGVGLSLRPMNRVWTREISGAVSLHLMKSNALGDESGMAAVVEGVPMSGGLLLGWAEQSPFAVAQANAAEYERRVVAAVEAEGENGFNAVAKKAGGSKTAVKAMLESLMERGKIDGDTTRKPHRYWVENQ